MELSKFLRGLILATSIATTMIAGWLLNINLQGIALLFIINLLALGAMSSIIHSMSPIFWIVAREEELKEKGLMIGERPSRPWLTWVMRNLPTEDY